MFIAGDLSYAGISAVSVLSAGIGAYIGSYLKKKAENLATHEDLDKLVEQMAAVTQTTESIKAAISDDVWDRQKQWELKREVLFEAARRVAEFYDALAAYSSAVNLSREEDEKWLGHHPEVSERWTKADIALEETLLLIAIVCKKETIDSFNTFKGAAYRLEKQMRMRELNAVTDSSARFDLCLADTRNCIRKELGIAALPTSRSIEFSAAPSPGSQNPE